jgi:signal peptidase I
MNDTNTKSVEAAPRPLITGPSRLRSVLSTLSVLLIAPLMALAITAYIFQSYEVDGPSMQTTLHNQDRLIIWKVSRTWARLTHHDYVPGRGDIIVFIKRGLYEDNSSKEKQLIKRVIGLPGDRVTVKDGKITIYDTAHQDGFQPDKTLPYGKVITTTEGNVDLIVPAGEVFVSGDNRANSLDSRYFGPVPASDIVGKLVVRILPFDSAEKF